MYLRMELRLMSRFSPITLLQVDVFVSIFIYIYYFNTYKTQGFQRSRGAGLRGSSVPEHHPELVQDHDPRLHRPQSLRRHSRQLRAPAGAR